MRETRIVYRSRMAGRRCLTWVGVGSGGEVEVGDEADAIEVSASVVWTAGGDGTKKGLASFMATVSSVSVATDNRKW